MFLSARSVCLVSISISKDLHHMLEFAEDAVEELSLVAMQIQDCVRDSGFSSPLQADNRARVAQTEETFCAPPTIESDILLDYELIVDERLPQGLLLARRLADKKVVALKVLADVPQTSSEVDLWQACLPHPQIVPLEAVYKNKFLSGHPMLSAYLDGRSDRAAPPDHRFLVAVMPRMPCDLIDHVLNPSTELSHEDIKDVLRQLLSALSHIHQQGFVHGDVKLDNILLESIAPLRIRLCDFGFARLSSVVPLTRQYSLNYIAPEAILSYEHALTHRGALLPLGTSIDVWAFGVVAFQLFAKLEPFPLRDSELGMRLSAGSHFPPNFRARVLTADFDSKALDAAPAIHEFITRVLVTKPELRMTAAQLLCEAFLRPA